MPSRPVASLDRFTKEYLDRQWQQLNARYFRNALPAIDILWGPRLTASMGLFYSRVGPRSRSAPPFAADRRVIRLSRPLFQCLAARSSHVESELIGTLAHEMIHQWQYDVLKRRPNHGEDFKRMMACMNRDGLGITVYHSLRQDIDSFVRYVWRCRRCGFQYRRQRRTIQPRRHQCGVCRGRLEEVPALPTVPDSVLISTPAHISDGCSTNSKAPVQLTLFSPGL